VVDQFLDRPHARIAYGIDGPPGPEGVLVVSHALTTSREYERGVGLFEWAPVADAGRWLVRFDRRGHGESTGRAEVDDYRWPTLADDLLAVAGAVSPDEPVDGLGESTGCILLLRAALAAPERFRRLVLVAPPTAWETRRDQAELYRAAADLVEQRGIDAWVRAASVLPRPPILREGGWQRNPVPALPAELLPSVMRGAADNDLPDPRELAALEHRVLILAWDTDPSHPLSTAERLRDALPNAELEVATTPDGIRGWGERVAAFLADDDAEDGPIDMAELAADAIELQSAG
jgi:pimeloyl-ACP methyl ester carboxylesterase